MTRGRYPPGTLAALLAVALVAGGTAAQVPGGPPASRSAMLRAAVAMADAIRVIRDARLARGLPFDLAADPNRTGLIGARWSPVTTTLGSATAKRTATNPNVAAALVLWLQQAGVRDGTVVAIGASGSFPGLIVATVAATRALSARPVVISSAAASQWGANNPAFTWLDMESALARALTWPRSEAASLGGEDDDAAGMEPGARARLEAAIRRADVTPVAGRTLRERIAARMAIYDRATAGRPPALFVNIGGAAANVGTCQVLPDLRPGLHRALPPCRGEPGAMWLMSARGVPVLHLLYVEGIARAFGLPVDRVPLPRPGEGAPFARPSRATSAALLGAYLAALVAIVRVGRTSRVRA